MIVRLRVACLACGREVGAVACPLCESLDRTEIAAGGAPSRQLEYTAGTPSPPPTATERNPTDADR